MGFQYWTAWSHGTVIAPKATAAASGNEIAYRLAHSAERCERFMSPSKKLFKREAIERYFARSTRSSHWQAMVQLRLFFAALALRIGKLRWKLCFHSEEIQFRHFEKKWYQLAHYARLKALVHYCHQRCITQASTSQRRVTAALSAR